MPNKKKSSRRAPRQLRVRAVMRDPIDNRKLARAFIALAEHLGQLSDSDEGRGLN